MKLMLHRSQKSGMMGKVTFALDARAELTSDESDHVNRYKMGKEVLYSKENVSIDGIHQKGAFGAIGTALAARALNITITAQDLVQGKHIECKDIIEMRAAEEQLKHACAVFKEVLESAAHFDGDEVIEF